MKLLAGSSITEEQPPTIELHLEPAGSSIYLKACPKGGLGGMDEVTLLEFSPDGEVTTIRHADGINKDNGACFKFNVMGGLVIRQIK